MIFNQNNFAYIDGANLYKGVEQLGWDLDYYRFRVWLKEKYQVQRAYLFFEFVSKYKNKKAPDGNETPQGSFL